MESKSVHLEEEDRLSDLPDSIIQHILSFLPSTKQAIQTSVLSKRWLKQWTGLPILSFDYYGMSSYNLHQSIDNTLILHESSKINKFHLDYSSYPKKDPNFASKIRFATSKNVEDLSLSSSYCVVYTLPEFLFNNASLFKLTTSNCVCMPNGKVNWGCLTALSMVGCQLTALAMEHILSGTPLLKSLKLINSPLLKSIELNDSFSEKIVIASKSLKILVFKSYMMVKVSVLEISCPNLEELSVGGIAMDDDPGLFAQVIKNVLSVCLFLQSFELDLCGGIEQLVIDSQSLKRFVLNGITNHFDIEVSCPQLDELYLCILNFKTAKLLNLPSSLCASIYFESHKALNTCKRMIQDIMQQLQHINELKIGGSSIKILSAMKVRDRFSPVLNIKCLTLTYPQLMKHHSGIACLLRISPVLEKLVIFVLPFHRMANQNFKNNYWISNKTVYSCLESHLKTIKIIGFLGTHEGREVMLNLVQFLLNKAKVLEKMVVVLEDNVRSSRLEISEILLSFPRCSQNATIETLCVDLKSVQGPIIDGEVLSGLKYTPYALGSQPLINMLSISFESSTLQHDEHLSEDPITVEQGTSCRSKAKARRVLPQEAKAAELEAKKLKLLKTVAAPPPRNHSWSDTN